MQLGAYVMADSAEEIERMVVLEEVQDIVAYVTGTLGDAPIDKLYAAATVGGGAAASTMIVALPRARRAWQEGDVAGTRKLVQFWSATTALNLLTREPDRALLQRQLTKGFTELLGGDGENLRWSLGTYEAQVQMKYDMAHEEDMSLVLDAFLYWWSLELLGEDFGVRSMPFPQRTHDDLWRACNEVGVPWLDPPIDLEELTMAMHLLGRAAESAREFHQSSMK